MGFDRYKRQMQVIGFGTRGQSKLDKARVLVVGAGGLGSACLPYLAAAGVGHISIMDADYIELSNLHRQVIYTENDIGQLKAQVAGDKLRLLNAQIEIKVIIDKIAAHNTRNLIKNFDLVVDCTDNYNAKYSINDACIKLNIPMVSASIEGMSGYMGVFAGKNSLNYRSLFNEPALNALNCADSGVIGSVSGIFGLMQANEAIKYLTGVGQVINKVVIFDLYEFSMRKIGLEPIFTSEFKPFEMVKHADIGNMQLLDVREKSEYEAGHYKGAVNCPLSNISSDLQCLLSLEKNKTWVVYCAKGGRAENAAIRMQRAGYKKLMLLNEGFV